MMQNQSKTKILKAWSALSIAMLKKIVGVEMKHEKESSKVKQSSIVPDYCIGILVWFRGFKGLWN